MSCLSLITAMPACCLAMILSPSFVSHNQAVWARASGTDWVKSAVDVSSCTIHVQTNYSYSFWRHYSSECEYTIRHRSEYVANIRYIPITNASQSPHNAISRMKIRGKFEFWNVFWEKPEFFSVYFTFGRHDCFDLLLALSSKCLCNFLYLWHDIFKQTVITF